MYNSESFCEAMMLNEALFGQRRETLELFAKELGVSFDFELRDIYLCLTGISRKKDWGDFTLRRPQYQQILHPLVEELLAWAQEEGLWVRYAVMHYDRSKQICFLLKKTAQSRLGVKEFAREAARRFEEEYRRQEGYVETGLANFTVISDLIPDYDHLAEAFSDLCRMKERSFFRMETGVFFREELEEKPVERTLLYEKVSELKGALCGEEEDLAQQVQSLFLGLVKSSMDPEVCAAVVHELNRVAFQTEQLFCPARQEMWKSLSKEDYVSIEQLEKAAEEQLLALREKILRTGNQKRHPLTLRTLGWLLRNYTQNVGLQEAAHYLGVSSSYLSRTFSRDMDVPFSTYLLRLRLDQAQKLLLETDLRIGQVAWQSGFQDPEYFGLLFRKKTGLPPHRYRELYQTKTRARQEDGGDGSSVLTN